MHMTNQMKEKMIEIGGGEQGNGDYDTLSNTDWNDNRQVEDENDDSDPLVQDSGFGTQARLWSPHLPVSCSRLEVAAPPSELQHSSI